MIDTGSNKKYIQPSLAKNPLSNDFVFYANFQCKTGNGEVLKFLIDTGSNKNYIQPSLAKNPLSNDFVFYANSVGGKTRISRHIFLNLFEVNEKLKFFILPSLKSFHGILGNDSLKQLNAITYTSEDYMLIKNGKRVPIKQQISKSVNNLEAKTEHLTKDQKEKLQTLCKQYSTLLAEPNEKLTYITTVKAEIRTNNNSPIYSGSYPYPMSLKSEVEKQINKLLKME